MKVCRAKLAEILRLLNDFAQLDLNFPMTSNVSLLRRGEKKSERGVYDIGNL